MHDTVKDRLREAQRNLADAARAIDAATINIRGALANDARAQAPYTPKGNDNDQHG